MTPCKCKVYEALGAITVAAPCQRVLSYGFQIYGPSAAPSCPGVCGSIHRCRFNIPFVSNSFFAVSWIEGYLVLPSSTETSLQVRPSILPCDVVEYPVYWSLYSPGRTESYVHRSVHHMLIELKFNLQ